MTKLYAPGTEPTTSRLNSREYRTPDHLLTAQAQGVPDEPVRLLDAWTPCAVCGQAAPKPNETNGRPRVDVARSATRSPSDLRMTTFMLTRCDDCEAVHRRAVAIVRAHPRLAGQLGPDLAVERVEDVLVALALAGQVGSALGPDTAPADLGLHLRHLHQVGSDLAWQRRAVAGMCNPHPFAHVRLGERRRLRAAYAGLLRERVAVAAPPVKVPPPPESRGCLLCGVGHVVLPADQVQHLGGRAAAADAVWTHLLTHTDALGGRPSPGRVEGHLCPPCTDAVQGEGSVGPSSMTTALLAALDADPDPAVRESVAKVRRDAQEVRPVGWGALAALDQDRRPNSRPWEHVSLG